MSVEDRINELGYNLGDPPQPLGQYVRCVVADGLAFTAGHGPFDEFGNVSMRGQVGGDLTLEQGQEAARLSVVSCLASLKSALGSLDRVEQIVKVLGFVNCAPGFTEHFSGDGRRVRVARSGIRACRSARPRRHRHDCAPRGHSSRDRAHRQGAPCRSVGGPEPIPRRSGCCAPVLRRRRGARARPAPPPAGTHE